MIEINWTYILILIVLLVTLDKVLTVINIKSVEKNFPGVNRLDIEKNPLAKEFFKQYGLFGGSVLYGIFSILTFLLALYLLKWCLSLFNVGNPLSISLWALTIWYSIVIGNNLFFLLKFNKLIP
jgi:hypothetical protein